MGLPNLQGRAPMHPGRGPGLTDRRLGQKGGTETVILTEAEMPSHFHTMNGTTEDDDSTQPGGHYFGQLSAVYNNGTPNVDMNAGALPSAGGGQAHNNRQPFLVLNFIIALQGLYPSRS